MRNISESGEEEEGLRPGHGEVHLLDLRAELGQHPQVVWLALGGVPAVVTLQLQIYHSEIINSSHSARTELRILLRVHPCFLHHPESLVQVIVI